MSAAALYDPGRTIRIEDDLESIFYVLLYYAIRFLPHSASQEAVGRILYEVFDDFSDGVKGISCGLGKYSLMQEGAINITTITGGDHVDPERAKKDFLVFYASPPSDANVRPSVHPINDIIANCLDWFNALYSLDDDRRPVALERGVVEVTDTPGSLLAEMAADPTEPGHGETRSNAITESMIGRAKNVRSHAALRSMLSRAPKWSGWPKECDKGEDKRPKGGYVMKETLATVSAVLSGPSVRSMKRSHADIEDSGKPETAEADAQDNEDNDSEDNEDASREPGTPSRSAPKRIRRV